MGRRGVRFLDYGREWRLPGLLYTDDLVQCDESQEDLRVMGGWFAEVYSRRALKVNVGKSRVMILNGQEGLESEVHVDGTHLDHVSEFRYLRCVLEKSGTDGADCSRNVASGRRVASAIRSLINARDLQLQCARVLGETLIVPVLMYGSDTMLWIRKVEIQNQGCKVRLPQGIARYQEGGQGPHCMDKGVVRSEGGSR